MKPYKNNDKKIKVLFVLPTLGAGGAERILVTLMNNISREDFAPEFLALNEDGPIKEWIAEDIPFHSFSHRSIKSSVFKIIRFIKEHQPDVIFTTMVHSNALLLLMKILFPHIRVIVREAALPSILITRYGLKGRLCKWVYKLLYPRADLVISNCSQMVDDFKHKIKIKTDNHRILFNPVDVDRIYAGVPERFELSEKRAQCVHFVAVGRLSFEKGYDRLFKALHGSPLNFDWRLDLIGEGAYRKTLEELIKRYNLEHNIFFHGYESNPWKIAASSDCLLLPSRWEGMPNVVLEGFACGIPAIAMREAGGIVDIQKFTDHENLKIVDTIEGFVEEMARVHATPKQNCVPSILPEQFMLPTIIKGFEGILRG